MDIILSSASGKPIYEQITNQVKLKIMKGELKPGQMLPSMRLLAKELRISVITTKRAYEDLEREGFIETVPSKGCFVLAKDLPSIKEEQRRIVKGHLKKAAEIAVESGFSKESVVTLLNEVFQEEC